MKKRHTLVRAQASPQEGQKEKQKKRDMTENVKTNHEAEGVNSQSQQDSRERGEGGKLSISNSLVNDSLHDLVQFLFMKMMISAET